MTKEYLRSELHGLLSSIDKTGKWHPTLLDHVLESVINSVYFQVHAQNPKALGQYIKAYSVSSALLVTGPGRYGLSIPATLVPLPDKRGGVRSLRSSLGLSVYFVPITHQELALMEDSQADNLITTSPSVIYYAVHEDVIDFKNMTATIAAAPFYLDLLVAFTSLTDTDEVPLPYGKNMEILKMALEILGVVSPKDLLDNNSDVK
jgi:hypothetical protein